MEEIVWEYRQVFLLPYIRKDNYLLLKGGYNVKKSKYAEMLGGENQVTGVTIIFLICFALSIFYYFNKSLDISQILIYIAFWGYILNASYIGIKVAKYRKSKKRKK